VNDLFTGQVRALGAALLGLFPLALYARQGRRMFVVYGFAICAAVYLASWIARIEIGGRFIFFATFFLHLAMALFTQERKLWSRTALRPPYGTRTVLAAASIASIVLPALTYRSAEMRKHLEGAFEHRFHIPSMESPAASFLFLTDHLGSSDVVLAHPMYGWFVPAITGAKVVAPLGLSPLAVEDGKQRQKDTLDFLGFSGARLGEDAKLELLGRYGVTHVLVAPANRGAWDPALPEQLARWAESEVSNGAVVLYELAGSL
jgi:hypothetical protein